ncbi:MAG TPA: SGNH/GDSL hydrolase family protein [Oligoflexus sp.]|uniref:SGNH/GDSL hydrolase family protein n=1 Tax=Oligoflexus sp. TaxID=1971216 RepID=UPI002D7EA5DD|nr:SGNH/GDSL hydrolase family protein [Oligoflexus sp.]HET9237696.1 SGNH/GDSL hydrolase family protein [Oligoflexus sp.]
MPIRMKQLMACAVVLASHKAPALPSSADVKKRIEKTSPSTPKSLQLTIIGDSISAGALAGTRLGSPSPELIAGIVGAVLTRDIGEFLNATLNPQAAYPEGDGSWSLRAQLLAQKGLSPANLTLNNESAPGRMMSQVTAPFVQRMKSASKKEAEQVILLMLGSNDFCQGKSPDDFLKATAGALKLLKAEFPKAQLFMAAVPPIDQLKKLGAEPLLGQVTCESVQRLYCDRIYADNAGAILQDYNEGLKKLVTESKDKDTRMKFISLPKDLTIDKSLLAADCFHPGVDGHKKLAATLAPQMIEASGSTP